MSVYKRGNVYWICYYWNGRQVREGVSRSRREAEAALAARKTDIRRGEFRHVPRRDRLNFSEAVWLFKAEKGAKRSLGRDDTSLRNLRPVLGLKMLDQITARDIEAYKAARVRKVKGSTVNRELALLKTIFNVAIAQGRITSNPVKSVKFFPETARRQDKKFSSLEVEHLVEASAPHLRPILATALFTGLRKGDVLSLRPQDIDLERHVIRIMMQKTGEPVEIPLHPILERILKPLLSEPTPHVFMSTRASRKTGEVTRQGDIKNAFRGALDRAGLAGRGFTFHDLRRTFASMLYSKGIPLLTVSKLLGHRSVKTTERYLGVKLEEKRQAVAVLGEEWGQAVEHPALTCTIHAQSPKMEPATRLLSA